MTEIVTADIGGTHARFALAEVVGGHVTALGQPVTLKTADHTGLETAWQAFAATVGRPLPRAAGIALASPMVGNLIKLTNSSWLIRPDSLAETIGVEALTLVNDFGAVAHAVAQLPENCFISLFGPDRPIADHDVISIVGPGTGLGVAQLIRGAGPYRVIETEGGHIDFAPLDPFEDAVLARLRARHRRVSVERIVAGSGLGALYEGLAAIESAPVPARSNQDLWIAALSGSDRLAAAALDRFCLSLGAVVGDIALGQGAQAVVIAGGLGRRLADHLPRSGFAERFIAKGRFERRMAEMPVKLITHPEPGLYGAAAAFAAEHRT